MTSINKHKFDPQKHHRRSLRLKGYDYSKEGAYYVTIVTWHRDCLFGEIKNEEMKEFAQVKDKLDEVNDNTKRILSQVDKQYADLIQLFTDEAKEGPRLFSLFPLDGSKFNPKNWIREKFRLVLWCEHSRLPLPVLNNGDMKKGVYDFELDKEWFKKTAPYLKLVTGTLSLVLPVASSALAVTNDAATKALQDQIGLAKM